MHEKLIREINGEIADALLARKLPFAPSRKAALALLKVPGWTEGLVMSRTFTRISSFGHLEPFPICSHCTAPGQDLQ